MFKYKYDIKTWTNTFHMMAMALIQIFIQNGKNNTNKMKKYEWWDKNGPFHHIIHKSREILINKKKMTSLI